MSNTTRIGNYSAMIAPIGFVFVDEANEAEEMWNTAAHLECDGGRVVNVEMVIGALESEDEPLSDAEQKLLNLCKAAEAQGLDDLIINRS